MTEVAIIGGGIAGLNLGIALQQRGIDFEIYERAEEYKTLGAGIILRIPPMIILDRLGLADPIESTGARHDVHVAFDRSGNELFHADLNSTLEPEFDQIGYGLLRNTLQNLQLDRLETGVNLGERCIDVTQDDESATAHFEDGTEVTADIVIGADGIFSQVRESLFPSVSVEYPGLVIHRGLPGSAPSFDKKGHWLVLGDSWSFGFIPLFEQSHEGYWFYNVSSEPKQNHDPDDVKQSALEHVENAPFAKEAVEATDPSDILSYDGCYVPPMDTWSDGRVMILGDAAHGMLPHRAIGGGIAIEDGYVLAECLAREPTVEAAFEEFESLRINRANEFVQRSLNFGEEMHSGKTPEIPDEEMVGMVREETVTNTGYILDY
jgi:2-polyprenyl-6-methoxyphenol hydroxylase-like FAD-dependent oxidoreductase